MSIEFDELAHGVRSFAEFLDLGPISHVEILAGPKEGPEEIARVWLEHTGHVGATLQDWLEVMSLMDASTGVYDDADTWQRLHLRGWFSSTATIVTAPWPRTSRQARLMREQIERQEIHRLVSQLAELDPEQG